MKQGKDPLFGLFDEFARPAAWLSTEAHRLLEVTFQRGIDGSEPVSSQPISVRAGAYEEHDVSRSWRLGSGTLACPQCDAPVALGARAVSLTEDLDCPFCRHSAPVRDFLSLGAPARPARVEVRMRPRARTARR
jgi:hypothetical protein